MLRKIGFSRCSRAMLSCAAIFACRNLAFAGAAFDSGTATIFFDPDTTSGNSADEKTVNLNPPPPSSAMPGPPNYQLSKTSVRNNSSAVGKGSIGYVANQTTATFTLSPGSGVAQTDPGNKEYKGDSVLRVSFNGLFKATDPGFGPPATGYVSVAVGGVVGAGGSARFDGHVDFKMTDAAQTPLRPSVDFHQSFGVGTFAQVFTNSSGFRPLSLSKGTTFRVIGTFEFRANNSKRPTRIDPLVLEVGTAPSSATWNSLNSGNWNDPRNWALAPGAIDLGLNPVFPGEPAPTGPNPPSIPQVPNGAGQRARFASSLNSKRTVSLGTDVTLSSLDFGNNGEMTVLSKPGVLVMDTQEKAAGAQAAIQARNSNGKKSNIIDSVLLLNKDLNINADGAYKPGASIRSARSNLYFQRNIVGAYAIYKDGNGSAFLEAANYYNGGTHIKEGKLIADAAGALGLGEVFVEDSQLTYNAKHAARVEKTIRASDGGEIALGVTPAADELFEINGLSAISGNAAALRSLEIKSNSEKSLLATDLQDLYNQASASKHAKLTISDGAMIAHEDFDPGLRGNPAGLTNVPRYIFGVADNFTSWIMSRSVHIGNAAGTPWIGFGSDRTERTFGPSRTNTRYFVFVEGAGKLVSLDETLWLNAKLVSTGSNPSLEKLGKGTVAIENLANDFHGTIAVIDGDLLVNGNLPNVKGISINSGATLGGLGTIDGPVTLQDGAILNPGSIKPTQRSGTLTTGNLVLSAKTALNFDLDNATNKTPAMHDFVIVNGNLTLNGTLNINDLGKFGAGSYTLIHCNGVISGPGLKVGETPSDEFDYAVITAGSDVNLTVTSKAKR